jgi:hypothetical protein
VAFTTLTFIHGCGTCFVSDSASPLDGESFDIQALKVAIYFALVAGLSATFSASLWLLSQVTCDPSCREAQLDDFIQSNAPCSRLHETVEDWKRSTEDLRRRRMLSDHTECLHETIQGLYGILEDLYASIESLIGGVDPAETTILHLCGQLESLQEAITDLLNQLRTLTEKDFSVHGAEYLRDNAQMQKVCLHIQQQCGSITEGTVSPAALHGHDGVKRNGDVGCLARPIKDHWYWLSLHCNLTCDFAIKWITDTGTSGDVSLMSAYMCVIAQILLFAWINRGAVHSILRSSA